jgi:hypothetical protein
MSARQQRAGEQERRADPLGVLAGDLRLAVDPRRADHDLVLVAPLGAGPEAAKDAEHRLDVADARDVAHEDLVGGQHRRRQDRQRRVLVPGGRDGAAQRHAAVDDELLHEMRGRRVQRRYQRLG